MFRVGNEGLMKRFAIQDCFHQKKGSGTFFLFSVEPVTGWFAQVDLIRGALV